jgi:cellulose synthase/poly-beta-1,6-N-acetylglucosamine synthase-like glycosyltransferase
MDTFVTAILTISTAVFAVPVTIFLMEVIAAATLSRRSVVPLDSANCDQWKQLAVLVPAHNESTGLLPTLADIKQQLRPGDRVLIVADNCTDDTAAVVSAHGAEVVERHDGTKLGKGFALDFGLKHIGLNPPDTVVMVDADCRLEPNAIERLRRICAVTHRPVQAAYLMKAPENVQLSLAVAEFAWRVKNWLRPLGLWTLGFPCQLTGTSMAFPWDVIRGVDLATGWIVEDLKLGLDLASQGHPPLFCPSARVTSQFASSLRGAETQRDRWERGHLMTIASAPRLIIKAITRRDWNLLVLALDLAVPPLSLLALLSTGIFVITGLYALLGFSLWPFVLCTAAVLAFLLATSVAWAQCGRDVVPVNATFLIAAYIVKKIGFYCAMLSNKFDAQWIRTDRGKPK